MMGWEQVCDLARNWKQPLSVDEEWQPLPGLTPYAGDPVGPPVESLPEDLLADAILTEECVNSLGTFWDREPIVPGHFHCYPISNDKIWDQLRAPGHGGHESGMMADTVLAPWRTRFREDDGQFGVSSGMVSAMTPERVRS
jgi:hypothetical protein